MKEIIIARLTVTPYGVLVEGYILLCLTEDEYPELQRLKRLGFKKIRSV